MKSELVVVISFNSHDMTFASWQIFTCHSVLWWFKNSLNVKVRVVAVSLMPQHVVVLKQPQREILHCGCFSSARMRCGRFFHSLSIFSL